MDCCAQIVCNETAQVIGVIGRIHDDVLGHRQPFDQPACLRAVAPLAGCNDRPDRQAERIHSGVDFGGQAAFGAANTGSLKPPF